MFKVIYSNNTREFFNDFCDAKNAALNYLTIHRFGEVQIIGGGFRKKIWNRF